MQFFSFAFDHPETARVQVIEVFRWRIWNSAGKSSCNVFGRADISAALSSLKIIWNIAAHTYTRRTRLPMRVVISHEMVLGAISQLRRGNHRFPDAL